MNPVASKSSTTINTSSSESCSIFELVEEMKQLGMSPRPILETAALNILHVYGSDTLAYTEIIIEQLSEQDNPNGLYLWQQINLILKEKISPSYITIH